MASQASFDIGDIDWFYEESRELWPNREPPRLVRVGVKSATIRCCSCENEWRAVNGQEKGQLISVLGGVMVQCENCEATGNISISDSDA